MHSADLTATAVETAGDVHQTAGVGGDHEIGSGLFDEASLILNHCPADAGIADREGSAKATTFIAPLQRKILQAADLAQQPLRLGLQAETAQMTRHVIRRFTLVTGSDIIDLEHIDHEIR